MDRDIIISTRTILSVLTLLLVLWLAIQIKAVLLLLFVAFTIAVGLMPVVAWWEKNKVSRGIAVLATLLGIGGGFIVLMVVALSPMVEQTRLLLQQLPFLLERLSGPGMDSYLENFGDTLARQLAVGSGSVFQVTLGAASALLTVVAALAIAGYMMMDMEDNKESLLKSLPTGLRGSSEKAFAEIEQRLGRWMRGELLLMLLVGVMSFLGLYLLRVDYALSLALIAGLLEIVPNIGPFVSLIPAAIVGFTHSPLTGFGVVALFILIQQVENNVLVPKVMQRAVGFNPLVTIIALLIGAKLFGLAGAILAVPATLTGVALIKNFLLRE